MHRTCGYEDHHYNHYHTRRNASTPAKVRLKLRDGKYLILTVVVVWVKKISSKVRAQAFHGLS
jgi:hypothetical protein